MMQNYNLRIFWIGLNLQKIISKILGFRHDEDHAPEEKKIWTPPTVIVISTVNDVEDFADAETDIKEEEE